jgi:hypothetical protein
VLLQRRPALEAVFTRESELRVRERDARLIREVVVDAGDGVGFFRAEGSEELLRQLFLLVERRARRKRAFRLGHDNLLRSRPPSAPSARRRSVIDSGYPTRWALPFPRTGGVLNADRNMTLADVRGHARA